MPLLIMMSARSELFDELLAEAMPIVESFRFKLLCFGGPLERALTPSGLDASGRFR